MIIRVAVLAYAFYRVSKAINDGMSKNIEE